LSHARTDSKADEGASSQGNKEEKESDFAAPEKPADAKSGALERRLVSQFAPAKTKPACGGLRTAGGTIERVQSDLRRTIGFPEAEESFAPVLRIAAEVLEVDPLDCLESVS
jgi:hypothetical protein